MILKIFMRTMIILGPQIIHPLASICLISSSVHVEVGPAFKVIVLGDQDELVGPPQHCIIAIT